MVARVVGCNRAYYPDTPRSCKVERGTEESGSVKIQCLIRNGKVAQFPTRPPNRSRAGRINSGGDVQGDL